MCIRDSLQTGRFNVSVLTQSAPFALFQRFGFQSGRTADKFAGLAFQRSANGLAYLAEHANAFFSARVVDALDYGSHTLFIAEVTETAALSSESSVTRCV